MKRFISISGLVLIFYRILKPEWVRRRRRRAMSAASQG